MTDLNWPELYHKNKNGKLYSWRIWVEGDTIHTEHGSIEGAKMLSAKTAEGKNLGKANETSSETQAKREAQSMWQKKRDKKYRESLDEAENEFILLPMLAKDFEKRKAKVEYPVDVQPKLDGVRCLAFWDGDRVKLMSRGAKEYDCPHISNELAKHLPKDYVLDGELYAHGVSFQTMMSWVKRLQADTLKLSYNAYDLIDLNNLKSQWAQRKLRLFIFLEDASLIHTKEVETFIAADEETVYRYQLKFMSEGYEGAIVRQHEGKYVIGGRSPDLLKVKTFLDHEFEIVGFHNGVGKFETCVIWECKTKEGNPFNVVPVGTFEERNVLLAEGASHIGKMLKVKFFEYSDDGVPRFPVALGFRLEEDM